MSLSGYKAQITAYVLFVGVFAACLLNAERVKCAISGKPYVARAANGFPCRASGNLVFTVSSVNINNRFEEGRWFIFEGDSLRLANESGNAKARVLLRSGDTLYELMENRQSFWSARTLKTVLSFTVPTCSLTNGIYQVGLHLSDDNGERCIWTDSWFEKIRGGPVEYVARPAEPIPAAVSGDVAFDVAFVQADAGIITLQGWAVLQNAWMDDYDAYVLIEDSGGVSKAFYAPLYTRMDIASLYDDPRAANSGFRVTVPRTELSPGNHAIEIMFKSRRDGRVVKSLQTETRNF